MLSSSDDDVAAVLFLRNVFLLVELVPPEVSFIVFFLFCLLCTISTGRDAASGSTVAYCCSLTAASAMFTYLRLVRYVRVV